MFVLLPRDCGLAGFREMATLAKTVWTIPVRGPSIGAPGITTYLYAAAFDDPNEAADEVEAFIRRRRFEVTEIIRDQPAMLSAVTIQALEIEDAEIRVL